MMQLVRIEERRNERTSFGSKFQSSSILSTVFVNYIATDVDIMYLSVCSSSYFLKYLN